MKVPPDNFKEISPPEFYAFTHRIKARVVRHATRPKREDWYLPDPLGLLVGVVENEKHYVNASVFAS